MASAADLKEALRSTSELDLTVTGRNSGKDSTRPVWFVDEADRVLLLPVTGSDSDWYRNVLQSPEVRLEAEGAELSATARPLEDPDGVAGVVEKFRQKYGADQVREYYPRTDAAVEVPLG